MNIEKNVPLSPRSSHRLKYPWAEMQIGDSFFVTGVNQKSMAMTAKYQTEKTGKTYLARTVDGGVRVWRNS